MKKWLLLAAALLLWPIAAQAQVTDPLLVRGTSVRVTKTLTVQNAAYVTGNCVGGFTSVTLARVNGGTGIINSVVVKSIGGTTSTLTVYLFDSNPSASTCTDKGSFLLNSADADKLIVSPFAVTLAAPTGTNMTFAEVTNMVRTFQAATGTRSVYVALVAGSSFTPATTSDLRVSIQAVLD